MKSLKIEILSDENHDDHDKYINDDSDDNYGSVSCGYIDCLEVYSNHPFITMCFMMKMHIILEKDE